MTLPLASMKGGHTKKCPYLMGLTFYTAVIFSLIVVTIYLSHLKEYNSESINFDSSSHTNPKCQESCNIQIVESIPEGLNFSQGSPKSMSTYAAWLELIDLANVSLDIGSMYWTLRGADVFNHSSAAAGEDIFKRLLLKGMDCDFELRIANNAPMPDEPNYDLNILQQHNASDVRYVNFTRLLGGGVLHTKLWIADDKHFYIGSANMDWRALTQVKELGVLVTNCPCLAQDVKKIFNAYWYLGADMSTIPKPWPHEFDTEFNNEHPVNIEFNNSFNMLTYFSSSPPPFSSHGRTHDVDAVIETILKAKSFVNIAVMDYFPLLIYTSKITYWPLIDDAIRKAAVENKVSIKMLISWWPHSNPSEDYFLKSLTAISTSFEGVDVQIKRFIVPSNEDQSKIPYGRVNHNKYMVTDNTAYIGTSNWSGDYFTDTAGIALVFRENVTSAGENIRIDLLNIFQRDWNSEYAQDLK